jgi:hypothetical protein
LGVEPVIAQQRCRKCGGNLFDGEDVYSRYVSCLQCGSSQELTRMTSLDEVLEATLGPQRARLGLAPERTTVR